MKTKNKKDTKTFDSIKVMRQIRDKLSLEIMNMSFEEERAYLDKLLTKENKKSNSQCLTASGCEKT